MTRRERWTRLLGLAAALAILGFCLSRAFEPTPGAWGPAPAYGAVLGPGISYYWGPNGAVTDPAEQRRASEEVGRMLNAPLAPGR